jgi:hypothetical protein
VAYPPNKISKTVLKMQAFYLFFEILLGSEQLQNVKINWRLLTEMNRIARFEKVSKEKFFEGWKDTFETAEDLEDITAKSVKAFVVSEIISEDFVTE